jgi:hypothetical protein
MPDHPSFALNSAHDARLWHPCFRINRALREGEPALNPSLTGR